MKPDSKPAYLALAIIAAYVAARHSIYQAVPLFDYTTWLNRDMVMSVPRLIGLILCLLVISRRGGPRRWGWGFRLAWLGGAALVLTTAMEIFLMKSPAAEATFSPRQLLLGWLSTGPVALFEEAAFRSVLFLSLRRRMSPLAAALLSSLAFAVYHIEAQSVTVWPYTFAFGMGTCAALDQGVGIGALVAAHWFVDGVALHLTGGPVSRWSWLGDSVFMPLTLIYSAVLLRYGGSYVWDDRERP